jgi:hypothetical protein
MARTRGKVQSVNPGVFSGASLLTLFVGVNGLDHLSSEDLATLALVSKEFSGNVRDKVRHNCYYSLCRWIHPPTAPLLQGNGQHFNFASASLLVQISSLSLSVAGFSTAQEQLQWLHLHQLGPAKPSAAVESSNRRRSSRQQEGQEQEDAGPANGAAAAAAAAGPNLAAHLVSRMPQLSSMRLMYNTIAQVCRGSYDSQVVCLGGGGTHANAHSTQAYIHIYIYIFLGVFVTREHVRHNKSGIAHRGRTGINH